MSARFDLMPTALAGVVVVQRKPIGDARGFLERLYCADEMAELFGERRIAQINRTRTERAGTVRGLHYQRPPHMEAKLVICTVGEVFDVAVDLRRDSPTFLHWHAERLSADNHVSLFIPEGCAHGFQTRVDGCELLYLHSRAHAPDAEAGVAAEDPRLGIKWPHAITVMSERDRAHARLTREFTGLPEH
jgi:dTDP-4-dehydrorhamnose 3,5-epimerase